MTTDIVEEQVSQLLHRQAAEIVVPPPDPYAVLSARPEAQVVARPGRSRSRFVFVGVTALVALAAVGVVLRWGAPGTITVPTTDPTPPSDTITVPTTDPTPPSGQESGLDREFDFDTRIGARLRAAEITVEAGGQIFIPTGAAVDVDGDPGYPANGSESGYQTLELTWFEHDVEMRINLYFASDHADWWISEIRTYDGNDPGEWITMVGDRARTPIGQPFIGELDAGPLHLGELVLEAFVPPTTNCDGSGTPGEIHLELTGPRPVGGEPSGVEAGYATTFAVLDAATCEPAPPPDGVDFRASTAPEGVAVVDQGQLAYNPAWAPGELYVSVSFVGVGHTTLTIEAVDQQTGNVVARTATPVLVEEGDDS